MPRPGSRPVAAHGVPRPGWLQVLLVLLLAVPLVAGPAPLGHAADNALVVTVPGIREQVDRPPGFVTLAFAAPVDPSLAKILVQDATGANVTTGELVVEGTNLSSQLQEGLQPGTYTVSYRVADSEGNPQGGTFQFSYGPGSFTDAADRRWSGETAEPEVLKNQNPNAVTPAPPTSDEPTTPVATPGPGATASTSATATPPATSDPTAGGPASTPGRTTGPASAGDPGLPSTSTLVLGALALVALIGAGVGVLLHRRRSGGRHR